MKKTNFPSAFRSLLKWFLRVKISLVLAAVLSILFCVLVWSVTVYFFNVAVGSSKINGVGFGVYWDSNCDNPVTSFSWGKIIVYPFMVTTSKSIVLYLRNEVNVPMIIQLNASDWSPSRVQDYLRLSWDYDGHVLQVNEIARITLTLYADSMIWFAYPKVQDFSFNITIFTVTS